MEQTIQFIQTKQIDSFQKLRFLLFLYHHPDLNGTQQELAEQLYWGNTPQLEQIIHDLQGVGLVDCVNNQCQLHDQPEIKTCIQCLARLFDDPLARQKLIDQVRFSLGTGSKTGSKQGGDAQE